MLVLSRKLNETIVIDGGRIVVKVIAAAYGCARIAISAPREVLVDRGEIHERRMRGEFDGNTECDVSALGDLDHHLRAPTPPVRPVVGGGESGEPLVTSDARGQSR